MFSTYLQFWNARRIQTAGGAATVAVNILKLIFFAKMTVGQFASTQANKRLNEQR